MKNSITPDSKIKSALRRLWLYSRERSEALKREQYKCEICGKKQSKSKDNPIKVQVHHKKVIDWQKIYKYLRNKLLCDADGLQVLCTDCHHEVHHGGKDK